MAKVNLTLPNLDLDNLNDSQIIRKIASYLYIQNEQLRYELTHIDEDNMSSEESTTVQGMTQEQIRKAIEEAIRQNKDIDLSSNTVIINMQRKMDNLAKLQAQDASNITRITQELGNKVSQTTYAAGLSGLKNLINGNTALISGLTTNLGQLSTAYYSHKHQIAIDEYGEISMGGPTATVRNPNISDTAFFKQAVADARPSGIERITMTDSYYSGNATVFCIDDGEFDVPIEIDGSGIPGLHTTERTNAAYGLSAPEYLEAGDTVTRDGYYYYRATLMARKTLYE